MPKEHLAIANSNIMLLLCGITILIVLIQPIIFMRIAWKRGKEIGLTSDEMKKATKSSSVFAIIPSLPIIISYLMLVPALGKFFPWLRLSVVGSVTYETMAANMAAEAFGYESIFASNFTPDVFIAIIFVVSVAILGGNMFNVLFLKKYDEKVRSMKSLNSAVVPIMTTAMFLGMYGVLAAPHISNVKNPLSITTLVISGIASLVFGKLSEKHKSLKEFSFSLSIIAGMASASLLNLFLK
ncbi:DUF5058 family protein [Clostridium sp. MSJ-11]|uniref:DUF5058 family protein n=1 Tax=Clostridium mobile TaxID=2841512 RepID=A0ABS6EH22_9CLOT|nr:DUF5058 family protein [Clostridium mobile]MBU5484514.1 DUF5058 family protein [Clostridium mobile]